MDETNFQNLTYDRERMLSVNNSETSSDTNFDLFAETLATFLSVYYTPLLVFLGCVGNVISVYVFFCRLLFQSTSLYLSALAISDTIFLLQLIPPWLNAVQSTVLFHQPVFCELFVYFSFVTCVLSAWLVVAFTVERFVAVMYPLQRNILCTMTRAKHIVALLVLAALILNIPVLRFASPGTNDCNIATEYVDHAARFNMVDTALSFTFPLAVIVILNTCIMVGVYRIERVRRALMKIEEEEGGLGERLPPPLAQRSQHRVTRMLLTVSSVFVLLNLPGYTMRVLAYAYDMNLPWPTWMPRSTAQLKHLNRATEYTGRWAAVQQVSLMFFHTNFGINFILYCLSGQNFRRALCQAIPCLRRFVRRSDDIALTSIHSCRARSVSTGNESAHTATSSRVCVASIEPPPRERRYRSEPVIQRWRFDNSRQLRAAEPPPPYSLHSPNFDAIRPEPPPPCAVHFPDFDAIRPEPPPPCPIHSRDFDAIRPEPPPPCPIHSRDFDAIRPESPIQVEGGVERRVEDLTPPPPPAYRGIVTSYFRFPHLFLPR